MNKIVQYEEDNNGGTLNDLLEDIALVADIDTVSDDAEQVLLMTLHSAKGLEFPNVYICGMEETIFRGLPPYLAMTHLNWKKNADSATWELPVP